MTDNEMSDLAIEIVTDEPTDEQVELARQLINHCRTSTLALRALQSAIRDDVGDEQGALLISMSGLLHKMAVHEAENI